MHSPFHHITSYWAILQLTRFRLGASITSGIAFAGLAVVCICHAMRRDHCLRGPFLCAVAALVCVSWHFVSVAVSLYLLPVPTIARGGVSVGLILCGFGSWYLWIASMGFYPRVAKMLKEDRKDALAVAQHGLAGYRRRWPQFKRAHHDVI